MAVLAHHGPMTLSARHAPSTPGHHAPRIRVGIGGWTYAPWRGSFYPKGLAAHRELAYASQALGTIEVNGTYYRAMPASSFAAWHDETPEGFVFSLKAPRFATNRRVLGDAGDAVARFVQGGMAQLKDKLGPIMWSFAPTKRFEPEDFEAFLRLLPRELDGRPLRHALDVRHASFRCSEYLDMARRHGMTTVFTEAQDHPPVPDLTGDFVYLRLKRTRASRREGLSGPQLDAVAACARCWRDGGEPAGLPLVRASSTPAIAKAGGREVFVYFIAGAKERAPAAAMALQRRLAT